ncbi:MAG: DUF72 domain-containing protein [Deltaproteobacteria bacterium]|nr:DUF72 domain-containing protein [Deltaproteobacteria bacterium]
MRLKAREVEKPLGFSLAGVKVINPEPQAPPVRVQARVNLGASMVELRTEALLGGAVLEVFARHGLGQVLSHWTWGTWYCVSWTPRGMRYEEAYAKAHPFDALVEGMMSAPMVEESADIAARAMEQGVRVSVIVNNRAGGNAPLIARHVAECFLRRRKPGAA